MTTAFRPQPLPLAVAAAVRDRLAEAHRTRPFSTADPRDTVRRVTALLGDLPLATTVYRGGVDLCGMEVDHVWLALADQRDEGGADAAGDGAYVLDAAFPLFEAGFVTVLRRFVVGEADVDDLESVAVAAGVEARVLGEFPTPMRYLGEPVWDLRAPR